MGTFETIKGKKRRHDRIWIMCSIVIVALAVVLNKSGLYQSATLPGNIISAGDSALKNSQSGNVASANVNGANTVATISKNANQQIIDTTVSTNSPPSLSSSVPPVRTPAPLKSASVNLSNQTLKPVSSSMLSTSVPTKSPSPQRR